MVGSFGSFDSDFCDYSKGIVRFASLEALWGHILKDSLARVEQGSG